MSNERIPIPFHFHPYKFEERKHVCEKEDEKGNKRRYLYGITSGMKIDGHEERMTKKCIDRMLEQSKGRNILLYEGQHGVQYTDDIGKLEDSEVTPTGEWITTYRLYDQYDGFQPGSFKLEKADTLWKQLNGIAPYDHPSQRGFSIEGYIPAGGILEMDEEGRHRVIDDVEIDGVIVTPRPAYTDSAATAIYKALGEMQPEKKDAYQQSLRSKFTEKVIKDETRQSYYSKRYKLEDALNESIEEIMKRGDQVKAKLEVLFQEYGDAMVSLITSHVSAFEKEDSPESQAVVSKAQRFQLLKDIESILKHYVQRRDARVVNKSNKEKGNANSIRNTQLGRANIVRKRSLPSSTDSRKPESRGSGRGGKE